MAQTLETDGRLCEMEIVWRLDGLCWKTRRTLRRTRNPENNFGSLSPISIYLHRRPWGRRGTRFQFRVGNRGEGCRTGLDGSSEVDKQVWRGCIVLRYRSCAKPAVRRCIDDSWGQNTCWSANFSCRRFFSRAPSSEFQAYAWKPKILVAAIFETTLKRRGGHVVGEAHAG